MTPGGPRPSGPGGEGELPVASFDEARQSLYERGTKHRGPRELLLRAVGMMESDRAGDALDLGAGLGKECEELLKRGWRVTATDRSRRMLDAVRQRAETIGALDRLTLVHATFDATPMPEHAFDLVHAGFALPFCAERDFPATWQAIRRSLRPGGWFVGQFFGPRDEFVITAPPGSMAAHDASAVRSLLRGFRVLVHEEVDRPGETAPGTPKHWHVHHVIAVL